MALGKIVPAFTKEDFTRMVQERMLRIDQALVLRLKRIGETFVKNAREKGTYNDVTGNLRNSVGYVILRDGVQLSENFKQSASVTGGGKKSKGSKDGVNTGRDFAYEVARNFPKGYVLIVVAGMEYAASVEARGKDVLTASSITAKNDLRIAIAELSKKIPNIR